jgi:hypothetical protein
VTKKSIKQRSNIISEGRKGLFEKGKRKGESRRQKCFCKMEEKNNLQKKVKCEK